MKKWITLLTCAAFTLSSVHADNAPPVDSMEVPQELADDDADPVQDTGRKQVGRAANDGSKTAGQSAQKYVLAACIVALGITALILVSKNHGHHHHHHHHKH